MMHPAAKGHGDPMHTMHNHGDEMQQHEEAQIAQREKFLNVWIYFNLIFNTILLPLLVITFIFSKKAKRHAALVSMCITWIFSGIFSLLVFYCGDYGPNKKPSPMLCVAQTSLLYGIAPMWAVAVLMLMVYISMAFRQPSKMATGFSLILLLAAPYITLVLFSLTTLVLSINNEKNVHIKYQVFYCALFNEPLLITMGLFTTIVGIMIVLLEVYLASIVYLIWQGRKRAGEPGHIDFQILVRVLVFSGYIILGIVMEFIKTINPMSVLPDVYVATAGAVVFLTFGTQLDVIRVWLCWLPPRWKPNFLKDKHSEEPPPYPMTSMAWSGGTKAKAVDDTDEVPPTPPPKPIWYLNGMRLNMTQV